MCHHRVRILLTKIFEDNSISMCIEEQVSLKLSVDSFLIPLRDKTVTSFTEPICKPYETKRISLMEQVLKGIGIVFTDNVFYGRIPRRIVSVGEKTTIFKLPNS